MRERTRRQLCQLLFVVTCIVPTLCTLSWAAYRYSPIFAAAERARWEQRLLAGTGLLTQIERVEYPEGGSVLLSGISLTDPDGGQLVARLRQAEFKRMAEGTVVVLSQPEVQRGKLLRLCDVLHHRVLRGSPPDRPLQIGANELTLEVGGRAQSFAELSCTLEARESGVSVLFDFRVAGSARSAALQIVRNRQTSPPATQWRLDTAAPVPCVLFADYLPGLNRLGSSSTFQGTVWARELGGMWSAEIVNAQFRNLDLESLTEPFPHRLGGLAAARIHRAVFSEGVLREAAGELQAAGGTVSRSLLAALADHFGAAAASTPQSQIPYAELACEFAIGEGSMKLEGRCSRGRPGTLFASSTGELVIAQPNRWYSLVDFVRAMSPDSQWLVPATSESQQLLARLPLPTHDSPPAGLAQHPRLRLIPTQGVQPAAHTQR